MALTDDYILGNGVLHQRLRLATEILSALASCAPQPLTIAQLEQRTGRPAKELIKLCTPLSHALLLRAAPRLGQGWLLAAPASAITLEDVFRCVLEMQTPRGNSARNADRERASRDLDLLMMQATIAINQSVFKHLRQFTLDRLKARASSVASLRSLMSSRSRYDDNPDFVPIS